MRSSSKTDPSHRRTSLCLTNLKGVPRSLGPSQLPLLLLLLRARRRKRSVRNSLVVFSTLALGHVFAVWCLFPAAYFQKNSIWSRAQPWITSTLSQNQTSLSMTLNLEPDEPLNDPEP